ncbi:putative caspase-like protein [Bradyrhizobium sp. USDA 4532]|uniref:caspase family protein n=1 Tax=unclassified Bradyrhizobium TaxID=2631580 RepID=UPI00209E8D45|nr:MULTISPECIES: caspase family protein [unclassified Bradyrhizobium]MCP1831638.1 putative caspase-like protein [Bradyrhizobium sp. USDA 4545]MCP1916475.1 putative caspase-like protein [Bradyrhizobium sp. USDA 4532]
MQDARGNRKSWHVRTATFGLVLFTALLVTQASAQERVALVIGNSQYRKVNPLPNPVNDASDMTASLTRLGFSVKNLNDLDFDGFRRALVDFANVARTADQAVIFFAGHGVEIDGKNWLIPIDAEVKSEIDVYAEAINLETLIDISVMPKTIGLVILDACRNNPFVSGKAPPSKSMSGSKSKRLPADSSTKFARKTSAAEAPGGLAPVEVSDNVLVAYAAAAGTIARDGRGRNSPYSGSLLRHVEAPGLEINYLFRLVHDDVVQETKYQEPAVYGTLSKEEIYFKQGDAPSTPTVDLEPEAEALAWQFVRATNDIATLRRFSDQFPTSPHAEEVRERVAQLESAENLAWAIVERQKSISAYRAYLDLYPYGTRVDQARATLASLEAAASSKKVAAVELPRPPASKYQTASASVDLNGKNPEVVEKAWEVLKPSRDQRLVSRFSQAYPSLKSHRLSPGSDLSLSSINPTDLMIKTAQDEDVNQCFGGHPAACAKATQKYPDYVQLKFQLCRAKGNPKGCMTQAVENARKRGLLVSRFTRSELEKARNKEYRRVASRVQENVGNVVSNVISNTVSTSVSNAVGAAVSAAAGRAAAAAASAAAARAASTAASTAAAHAASGAATRAASSAASRAASSAASKAAADAAAQAAARAAGNIRIPSDIRLKRDVVQLNVVRRGLRLYRYKYLGDNTYYVGVIAQDVAKRIPAAVGRAPDGYLQVDYAMLGLDFMTLAEWTKTHRQRAHSVISSSR